MYYDGAAPSLFSCNHDVTVWQRHSRRGADAWRCRTVTIENACDGAVLPRCKNRARAAAALDR